MRTPLVLVLLIGLSSTAIATEKEVFRWKGPLDAGKWLRIRDLNGEVTVTAADGKDAEVVAIAKSKTDDPATVQVVQKAGTDGTTFCAIWPAKSSKCESDGTYDMDGTSRNDVRIAFLVKLPKGVKLDASTVNGPVKVSGATSELKVETVNGPVEVRNSVGPAVVESTNGPVTVEVQTAPLHVEATNGTIEVHLPANLDADVTAETVNGSIEVNIPFTTTAQTRRSLAGRLNKGGKPISLETVNGSIELSGR